MADQPEVIQKELEETRHDLAEKLEQIGEKISGTVDTVTDTVNEVTETVSHVTEAVEGTVQTVADTVSNSVEAVKETVASVGETASETVEKVKQAFNVSELVRSHPWAWFGGSVVVGFVGGKIFAPRRRRTWEAKSFVEGHGYYEEPEQASQPRQRFEPEYGNGRMEAAAEAPSERATAPSMLSTMFHSFGPEINRLRELAVGTLFGVVRDMIARALPESLKDQVENLVNDFTTKAGGKPIQGSVLDEGSQESSENAGGHDQSFPQGTADESSRSAGTTGKKSKAGAGAGNR